MEKNIFEKIRDEEAQSSIVYKDENKIYLSSIGFSHLTTLHPRSLQ